MTSQEKENVLKWIQEGLDLPDVEHLCQIISEDKQSPYPFQLLMQTLTALRRPEYREELNNYIAKDDPVKVVDMRSWKSNHIQRAG